MKTKFSHSDKKQQWARFAAGLTIALAGSALAGRAMADPPVTMAPPIESSNATSDDAAGNVSHDSVFNWSEIPQNQQVPIRRAVFDRGGYQLYDTVGETIVVPFANQNLYVMKFALSPDGSTYFVNTGDAPILYLPKGASLENASVPGARWYPFSDDFHPATPVFLGIAPSYSDYIAMGWYPDMYCYGGYYGHRSFLAGGIFFPSFGLTFIIGGNRYHGWEPYHHYYYGHPAPYRVTIINNNFYRGSYRHYDTFHGGGYHTYANHSFGGDHNFGGRSYDGGHTFGGGHEFHGAHDAGTYHNSGGHDFGGGRVTHPDDGHSFGGTHTFQGVRPGSTWSRGDDGGRGSYSGGDHSRPTFNGGSGGDHNRPTFSGGGDHSRPTFSGGNDDHSRPTFSGGGGDHSRPTFSGGGGDHSRSSSYSGGDHGRSSDGGGRSDSRGDGGGHSDFHGGDGGGSRR